MFCPGLRYLNLKIYRECCPSSAAAAAAAARLLMILWHRIDNSPGIVFSSPVTNSWLCMCSVPRLQSLYAFRGCPDRFRPFISCSAFLQILAAATHHWQVSSLKLILLYYLTSQMVCVRIVLNLSTMIFPKMMGMIYEAAM